MNVGAGLDGMEQGYHNRSARRITAVLGAMDGADLELPGAAHFPYRRSGGVQVGAAGFQHLIAVNQVGKRFFNEMRVTQQHGSSQYPQNGAIKKWNEYVQGDWRNCRPEAVKAVKQLHDMVFKDKSIVPPGEQGDYFSGNSAMTVNQISRASKMAEADFKWGIAPLPTGPGGESPVIGQAGLVVFAQGKNTEIAAEFVAHMTNKENVATMAQFFPPARKSVLQADAFINGNKLVPPEMMKNVAAAIEKGRVVSANEKAPQILAAMAPRVDALWKPDADVDAAIKGICAAIQPLL